MPETPLDLSHHSKILLDFWFAPQGASERDRLGDLPWRASPQTCLALVLLLVMTARCLYERRFVRVFIPEASVICSMGRLHDGEQRLGHAGR